MALTPQQAKRPTREALSPEEVRIRAIESVVDDLLQRGQLANQDSIEVPESVIGHPAEDRAKAVVQKYRNAGWRVDEGVGGSRDGVYYVFSQASQVPA